MAIDIIDLNDPKYSNLNLLQMQMVRTAQAKKDKIEEEAEEEKWQIFRILLANNTVRSSALDAEKKRIDADTEKQVESVRQGLLHELAYEGWEWSGDENGPYRYPDNPNYELSYSQRYIVVYDYYMHVTDNPSVRLNSYTADSLARSYLGEYYSTLYSVLASYIK